MEPHFNFHRLKVYHKARQFHLRIENITGTAELPWYLKDQLLRASLSIVLNIAEGTGRPGTREKQRFFSIARSSVFECAAMADILIATSRINDTDALEILASANELSRMLFSLGKNPGW